MATAQQCIEQLPHCVRSQWIFEVFSRIALFTSRHSNIFLWVLGELLLLNVYFVSEVGFLTLYILFFFYMIAI